MFRMINPVREYAWGSTTALSELFGWAPSSNPQAEIWMGSHPKAPSKIMTDDDDAAAQITLSNLLELLSAIGQPAGDSDPVGMGEGAGLPFLMKVLAVDKPLSIQTHPRQQQAESGFLAENAAGISLQSPERNYGDPRHKPELLVALTDFSSLCGFRERGESEQVLTQIIELIHSPQGAASQDSVAESDRAESTELLLQLQQLIAAEGYAAALDFILVAQVSRCKRAAQVIAQAVAQGAAGGRNKYEGESAASISGANQQMRPQLMDTLERITASFPADPGLLVAVLLNRVDLSAGEALFLPAGQMHCYLGGVGVEIMAASDNVLRGGLTSKHIDVQELVAATDATPVRHGLCVPRTTDIEPGKVTADWFRPAVEEFQLGRVDFNADGGEFLSQQLTHSVVLCTAGTVQTELGPLHPGQSLFLTAGERAAFRATGAAQLFIATTGEGETHD